jgi:hypothetical protein
MYVALFLFLFFLHVPSLVLFVFVLAKQAIKTKVPPGTTTVSQTHPIVHSTTSLALPQPIEYALFRSSAFLTFFDPSK